MKAFMKTMQWLIYIRNVARLKISMVGACPARSMSSTQRRNPRLLKQARKSQVCHICYLKSLFKQIWWYFFPAQVNGEIFTWGATVPTQRALAGSSCLFCCNLEAYQDYEDAKEKKIRRRRKWKEDSVICCWSKPAMPKYVLPVLSIS